MKRPIRDTARDARGNQVISEPQRRYMLRMLVLEAAKMRDGIQIAYPTRDILTKRGWIEKIPHDRTTVRGRALHALGSFKYRLTPKGTSIAKRIKDGTM